MLHYLQKSLKTKVFLAFFAIGLTPYFLIMLYFNYWVHDSLSSKQLLQLQTEAQHSKKLIENRIVQLQNELSFVASLELFNDMVTEDLDDRIFRLLKKKANIGKYEVLKLYATDIHGTIITASQKKLIGKKLYPQTTTHYIKDNTLFLVKALYSTLNHAALGYFIAEYPLKNLNTFVVHTLAKSYEIVPHTEVQKDITTVIPLDGLLEGYELRYYINKSLNNELLMQTFLFLLFLLLLGATLIYLFSKKFSKKFVTPIVELTTLSTKIIENKNFDVKIKSKNKDEIGALANVFNLLTMLQKEKSELLEQVSRVSEAKSTFISGMSHELRTPLNAIIGYAQYLMEYETLSEDQIQIIQKMERASLHLLSLINEILDIAKIEAGKMEIIESKINVEELLQDALDIVSPLAEKKSLSLTFHSQKVQITSDAKRLKQIVINLLSNAIKFTNGGSVEVWSEVDEKKLTIHVKDSGIGISKENLEKIFNHFVQLRDRNAQGSKGSGLGLALSKHIAEALGMHLFVESKGVNRGTHARIIIYL